MVTSGKSLKVSNYAFLRSNTYSTSEENQTNTFVFATYRLNKKGFKINGVPAYRPTVGLPRESGGGANTWLVLEGGPGVGEQSV